MVENYHLYNAYMTRSNDLFSMQFTRLKSPVGDHGSPFPLITNDKIIIR